MKADTERRSGRRIATRVPTQVRTAQGADHTAETRDVSASGVFLYTQSRMEKGTDVELVLILPPELTPEKSAGSAARPQSSGLKKRGRNSG